MVASGSSSLIPAETILVALPGMANSSTRRRTQPPIDVLSNKIIPPRSGGEIVPQRERWTNVDEQALIDRFVSRIKTVPAISLTLNYPTIVIEHTSIVLSNEVVFSFSPSRVSLLPVVGLAISLTMLVSAAASRCYDLGPTRQ